jgi:nitrate/nitrite-specific signal transduction histidine kinase
MAAREIPSDRMGPRVLHPEAETKRPLEELAALLRQGSALVEHERDSYRQAQKERDRLLRELENGRAEVDALAEMMARLERRSTQLTNLYVATFQLYAGRDPDQVYDTIAEIASDILGAERFVLLISDGDDRHYRVVLRRGLAPQSGDIFWREVYTGGDPAVDAALEDGTRWVQSSPGGMVAVVPLQVDKTILGVLVILKLLDHKPQLDGADGEILDLLGAHAASALLSSINLSNTARKLKTMTSLVRLVIGETDAL